MNGNLLHPFPIFLPKYKDTKGDSRLLHSPVYLWRCIKSEQQQRHLRSSCSSADIAFVKWWLPWSDRSNGLIGPVWNEEEDDEGVGEVECRREEGRRNQTLWFISICQIIHSSNIEQRKRCEALTPEWGKADKPFAVFNASFCSSIFIMRDSFGCTHQRNPLHIKYVTMELSLCGAPAPNTDWTS